ncbi:MAG TPA: amidohydrolase family protein [Candidatus Cloacimonadota bacterium]|nr:amidohydrolase family protein [Candidatus Cloacimonadota bacterium]
MKTLFTNAKFYSMDKRDDYFDACLVEDGYVKETFKGNIPNFQGNIVDLKGACVLPGFIDSHTHSFEGGLYSKGVDCSNIKDLAELFELLSQAKPMSNMVFAWNFDENSITEKRFPTIEELDRVIPHMPLLLRRSDGHSCIINTKALHSIKWKYPLPEPFTGLLRGDLNDNAAHWFHKNLSDESILDAYHAAEEIAFKTGHTTVFTMIGDAQDDVLHFDLIFKHRLDFRIDYELYPQILNIDKAQKCNEFLVGGCILADGSFGSHTAALCQPYADMPDNYGTAYQSQAFWDKFLLTANNRTLQTAVHCIGDFAIKQLITAIERAQAVGESFLQHQIIHCELVDDEMIERMAKAGISAVMQPAFDRYWGGENGFYAKVLGKERALSTNRLKSLVDAGVLVTGSSDWYVTPIDALLGIDSALNMHNPKERLDIYEAVSLYTRNPCKLIFVEPSFGFLVRNSNADFVCLDKDIFEAGNVKDTHITAVYKKGTKVYGDS